MNEIHANLPYKNFEKASVSSTSSHFVTVKVCKTSGKLATDACELAGEVESKLLPRTDVPNEYCDIHEIVNYCNASGKIANEYCPEEEVTATVHVKGEEAANETNEVCDVHGPEGTELPPDAEFPPSGDMPSIDGEPTDEPIIPDYNVPSEPSVSPSVPETSPSPSPSPSPDVELPPVVDPNVPPTIDDEDDFAIPQY